MSLGKRGTLYFILTVHAPLFKLTLQPHTHIFSLLSIIESLQNPTPALVTLRPTSLNSGVGRGYRWLRCLLQSFDPSGQAHPLLLTPSPRVQTPPRRTRQRTMGRSPNPRRMLPRRSSPSSNPRSKQRWRKRTNQTLSQKSSSEVGLNEFLICYQVLSSEVHVWELHRL